MINKERIQQLVDEFLAENEDIFLVSLKFVILNPHSYPEDTSFTSSLNRFKEESSPV